MWQKVVCHSSDKAFWEPFGPHDEERWRLKRRQNEKLVSDVFSELKLDQKLIDFGTKFEPGEDDNLLYVLKCANSIFEQQSSVFAKIKMWKKDNCWSSFEPIRRPKEQKRRSKKEIRNMSEDLKPLRKR